SPVPQTIRAKSLLPQGSLSEAGPLRHYLEVLGRIFLPIYYEMGGGEGWYPGIVGWSRALGAAAAAYFLLPLPDRFGRACSLAFALFGVYFSYLNYMFPWYAPPALVLALVALARGTSALVAARGPGRAVLRVAGLSVLSVVVCERGAMYALTAYQMNVQTAEVEMGNRARIGGWLKKHVRPGETVYVECVGYIGYFSGAHMLDWPGLVSPRVAKTARAGGYDFYSVIKPLRPDWVVLRPWEAARLAGVAPGFFGRYEPAASFDVNPKLAAYPYIPGRLYLTNDAAFTVYRRRPKSSRADPSHS